MRVLICFESSGIVREAFRAMGHNAWSCDLLPAEDGSPYHIKADFREALKRGPWDLVGFHPPCTHLCGSGIHWNNRGRGWQETEKSVELVRFCMSQPMPWYLENPVGIISTRIRKSDQRIQPYNFGEDASKKTCLWLHDLPPLKHTKFVPPRMVCPTCKGISPYSAGAKGCPHCGEEPAFLKPRWANQTDSGQNKLAPGPNRWKDRSRTYPGIAAAMAAQWGKA